MTVRHGEGRLRLSARDNGDLQVFSACLQDALVSVEEMAYVPGDRRFALLATRFRWEAQAAADDLPDAPRPQPTAAEGEEDASFTEVPLYERVRSALTIEKVKSVRYRGFARSAEGRLLNLLALQASGPKDILLQFSEDAAIQVTVQRLLCRLEDVSEPWPTHWRPSHADDPGALGEAERRDG